jgi:hypothetical protein
LKFGNRMVYLRRDVENFVEKRSRRNIEKAVETLMRDFEHLPETERQEARQLLDERLGTDGGTSNNQIEEAHDPEVTVATRGRSSSRETPTAHLTGDTVTKNA